MVGIVMQFSVVYLPVLQRVFRTTALGISELGLVVAGSLLLVVVVEAIKGVFLHRNSC